MFHPIFTVLLRKPELVVDHVSGYAGLVREEASAVGWELVECVVAGALAFIGALVFLMLAGTAVMVGVLQSQFHWTLVVVPAVPLALAVLAGLAALQKLPRDAFTELRAQWDADLQTLRTLGAQP